VQLHARSGFCGSPAGRSGPFPAGSCVCRRLGGVLRGAPASLVSCPAAPPRSAGEAGPVGRRWPRSAHSRPQALWGCGAGFLRLRFARTSRSAPSVEQSGGSPGDPPPKLLVNLCHSCVGLQRASTFVAVQSFWASYAGTVVLAYHGRGCGSIGRNPRLASCRPAMATLVVPRSSLEALSQRSPSPSEVCCSLCLEVQVAGDGLQQSLTVMGGRGKPPAES